MPIPAFPHKQKMRKLSVSQRNFHSITMDNLLLVITVERHSVQTRRTHISTQYYTWRNVLLTAGLALFPYSRENNFAQSGINMAHAVFKRHAISPLLLKYLPNSTSSSPLVLTIFVCVPLYVIPLQLCTPGVVIVYNSSCTQSIIYF
jgi:hypothetical protein